MLEFSLVEELGGHLARPLSRHALLAAVWGFGHRPWSNVADVCVRRVRRKLGSDAIKTVRGVGYQFAS
jgi:DNA-binding response OmpR family regulator